MKITLRIIILMIFLISGWIFFNAFAVFFTPVEVIFLFGMELSYVDGGDNSFTIFVVISSLLVTLGCWIVLFYKPKQNNS